MLIILLATASFSGLSAQKVQFTPIDNITTLWNQFITSSCQDNQGFLWFGTPAGIIRFDGYEVKMFGLSEEEESRISDPVVWSMVCQGSQLWIATENGLNRFDMTAETFTKFYHQPGDPKSLSHNQLETVFLSSTGDLWVGTHNGWSKLAAGQTNFERYFYDESAPKEARGITEDQYGDIWLSIGDELYQYQAGADTLIPHGPPRSSLTKEPGDEIIRVLFEDSFGHIWVGTELNGLYQYDPLEQAFINHFCLDQYDPQSLRHNRISALEEDDNRQLWVGTYGGGLHQLSLATNELRPSDFFNEENIQPTIVRSILKDQASNLWFGTEFEGFWAILRNKPNFRNFKLVDNGFEAPIFLAIEAASNDKIWLSSIDELFLFDLQAATFSKYTVQQKDRPNRKNIKLLHLERDSQGQLWATDDNQLFKLIPTGQNFTLESVHIPELQAGEWIREIEIDQENNIWIGTEIKILKYSPSLNASTTYNLTIAEVSYGNNQIINELQLDRSGRIWISTKAGLNRYYSEQDSFLFIPHTESVYGIGEDYAGNILACTSTKLVRLNLASNQFESIEPLNDLPIGAISVFPDSFGHLWIIFKAGLYRYNPNTLTIRLFDSTEGLGFGSISNPNWLQSSNGTVHLGGINWLSWFRPDEIPENSYLPPVVLTDLQLFNRSLPIRGSPVDTGGVESPMTTATSYINSLVFNHRQNDMSFTFAALDYTTPDQNSYRYRLLGYDSSWVYTDASNRTASFTNLSPGAYTFEVQAANNAGRWNPKGRTLSVYIKHPWYQRWWAISVWVILAIVAIWLLRRYEIRRQLARAEAQRLAELDLLKSRLYTNITHELRTPLTLILGLSQRLIPKAEERIQTGLQIIQRNGEQLLHLVNQMLDLAKLEGGFLKLQNTQGELVGFLNQQLMSIQPLAEQRNIRLVFESETEQLNCDADFDRLQQIINNLLSNAIKFTSAGDTIELRLATLTEHTLPFIAITISDNGPGIPAELLPQIFDRFFQADNSSTRQVEGTGIGLALCKELVELMGGEIKVKSQLQQGTSFQLLLPHTQTAPFNLPVITSNETAPTKHTIITPINNYVNAPESKTAKILIVEDHPDLQTFLVDSLQEQYQIQTASDGLQGLTIALEQIPDLIVSDVMMPQMDGFELCRRIKQDERTSHIPVILLTAKVDTAARLEGLNLGADAYLAKPFLIEELQIRIKRLLDIRQQLRIHYLKTASQTNLIDNTPSQVDGSVFEHSFVARAREIVLQQLDNPEFSAEDLYTGLHLSRTHLHRKITGLTGLSTNRFITYIRMEAAKRLLDKQELTISEVAYQTGYRTPEYFARVFRQTQGKSPTRYRQEG